MSTSAFNNATIAGHGLVILFVAALLQLQALLVASQEVAAISDNFDNNLRNGWTVYEPGSGNRQCARDVVPNYCWIPSWTVQNRRVQQNNVVGTGSWGPRMRNAYHYYGSSSQFRNGILFGATLPIQTMGISDAIVGSSQMTASTTLSGYAASSARVDNAWSSWRPTAADTAPTLTIDLLINYQITGFTTQGAPDVPAWTSTMFLDYRDRFNPSGPFINVTFPNGTLVVFNCNSDQNTAVYNDLPVPVMARWIRFRPLARSALGAALRVELHGRNDKDFFPLGFQAANILTMADQRFSSTSSINFNYDPWFGRLFNGRGWTPAINNRTEYMQVDLGQTSTITAFATQGRGDSNLWVTSYNVSFSTDGDTFVSVTNPNGTSRLFTGNTDRSTPVVQYLNTSISARYIRFHPFNWVAAGIGFRAEAYGPAPLGALLGNPGPFSFSDYTATVSIFAIGTQAHGMAFRFMSDDNHYEFKWYAGQQGNDTLYNAITRTSSNGNDPNFNNATFWCRHGNPSVNVLNQPNCMFDRNTSTFAATRTQEQPWLQMNFQGPWYRIHNVTVITGNTYTINVQVRTYPDGRQCGPLYQDFPNNSTMFVNCNWGAAGTGNSASALEVRVLLGVTQLRIVEVYVDAPDIAPRRMLVKRAGGVYSVLAEDALRYVLQTWYTLSVVCNGPQLMVYVNNSLVFNVTDTAFDRGTIAFTAPYTPGTYFDNFALTFLVNTLTSPFGNRSSVVQQGALSTKSGQWSHFKFSLPIVADYFVVSVMSTNDACCMDIYLKLGSAAVSWDYTVAVTGIQRTYSSVLLTPATVSNVYMGVFAASIASAVTTYNLSTVAMNATLINVGDTLSAVSVGINEWHFFRVAVLVAYDYIDIVLDLPIGAPVQAAGPLSLYMTAGAMPDLDNHDVLLTQPSTAANGSIGAQYSTRIAYPPGGTDYFVAIYGVNATVYNISITPPEPVLTGIAPPTGPTQGGTTLTITGSNFGPSGTVMVGASSCNVTVYSAGYIECVSPAGEGTSNAVSVRYLWMTSNTALFAYDPPTVLSVTPQTGPTAGGQRVRVQGSNFGLNPLVTIGSVQCTNITRTHTTINCTVGAGQGTSLPVQVGVLTQFSNADRLFNYLPPTITDFSPSRANTAGGALLTVTGTNFGTSGLVEIGVYRCNNTVYNDTTVICTIAPGEGANLVVRITVSGQVALSAGGFTFFDPVLTSINPTTGPTAGNTTIQVTGDNFGFTPRVIIGGLDCPVVWNNHTVANCTLPAQEGTNLTVQVTVASLSSAALPLFAYLPPVITSTTPITLPTLGAATLTIGGTNFGRNQGSVLVGGRTCGLLTQDHTNITCTIPAGQGTGVSVVVTVAGLASGSFLVNYTAPSLTSVTPANATTAGGTSLLLLGSNLGTSGSASFNGLSACAIVGGSQVHTQLRCISPAGVGVNHNITVTVSGQQSNAVTFNYNPPSITTVAPSSVATQGGALITLTGNFFGASGDGGIILVGSSQCSYLAVAYSHQQVICSSPIGSGLNVAVQLTVGTQTSNIAFLNYSAPSITSVSPGTGPTRGGTNITITGSSFDLSGYVLVDGANCSIISWSHTSILCSTPAGQGLVRPVEVFTSAGRWSPASSFSYQAPSVSTVLPAVGLTDGGYLITISGNNFGLNGTVTVNSAACSTSGGGTAWNHSTIVCVAPSGVGANQDVVVTVAGQSHIPARFSYAGPVITGLSPSGGIARGGNTLIISGTSLGALNGSVTVAGAACNMTFQNHSRIDCVVPAGTGMRVSVLVTVAAQTSSTAYYDYDAPRVDSVLPLNGGTQGGTELTIFGESFSVTAIPSVTIGGRPCPLLSGAPNNDTHLYCTLPSGSGAARPIIATVASTPSNANITFDYQPPVISTVEPSSGPTSGALDGFVLTLAGSNFGTAGTATVGGSPCVSVGAANHTHLQCILPTGQGINLPVLVSLAGQSSNVMNFSYDAPNITSISPQNGSTSGGTRLTILGRSFGTSGFVQVAGRPCAVVDSVYTHSRIECQLPSGQGSAVDVVVTSGTLSSTPTIDSTFSYLPPAIVSVTPLNGPTAGFLQGATITIVGSNFGLNGSISIGSYNCEPLSVGGYAHTRIECQLPEGQDTALPIVVTVGDQSVTGPLFNYDRPIINSASPTTGTTAGGYNLTIQGNNFGFERIVHLGSPSLPCPILEANHTMLVCSAPEGFGLNYGLKVYVGTGAVVGNGAVGLSLADPSLFLFSYLAPEIISVSGCVADGNATKECLPQGLQVITIHGDNFGSGSSGAQAFVTVDGIACAGNGEPLYSTPHTQMTCTLPWNVGYNLMVLVSIGGQTDQKPLVSYAGPVITDSSLRLCGGAGAAELNLTSTDAGVCIEFDGVYFGTNPDTVSYVTYGLPTATSQFSCTLVPGQSTNTHIRCNTQAAVGAGLVFRVHTDAGFGGLIQHSPPSSDKLNYPAPEIVPNSIRKSVSGNVSVGIVGTRSQGEQIVFDVKYIGHDSSLLRVWFGLAGQTKLSPCNAVQISSPSVGSSAGTIICQSGPGADGPYVFEVVANEQRSQEGTDTYEYPIAPKVYSVTGCTADGNATVDCSTEGGFRITVTGDKFTAEEMTCLIGSSYCGDITYISQQNFTCVLPPGAGILRPVVVITGVLFSRSNELLSYSLPNITSISGCSASGQAILTRDCPRVGGTVVTISGTNFGADRALVLVGGATCENVTHAPVPNSHRRVTCVLPSGTRVGVSTLLVQRNGEISSNSGFVSYFQCPTGQYAGEGVIACSPCEPGSYTDVAGSFQCKQCESGDFASGYGSQSCIKCPIGFFSQRNNSIGASNCTSCPPGQYTAATGQAICKQCDPGTYTAGSASTGCSACVAGTFADTTGQTSCTNCSAGSFSPSSGSIACKVCAAGRYGPSSGLSTCLDCEIGTARGPADLPTQCIPCAAGSAIGVKAQPTCAQCDAGRFANVSGLDACYPCSSGSFSQKQGSIGATTCTVCPVGEYMNVPGQAVCLQCNKGTYQDLTGQTTCAKCALGKAQPDIGFSSCSNCSAGLFSGAEGAVTCDVCPVGRFAAVTGASACTPCPVGQFQSLTGRTACTPCGLGTAVGTTGQPACRECNSGFFSNTSGLDDCLRCGLGSFSVKPTVGGPSACSACVAGQYMNAEGQAGCILCAVGTFNTLPGLSSCDSCQPGKFADVAGSTVCRNCTRGSYSPSSGALTCRSCPIGQVSAADGASECTPCPAGYHAPNTGDYQCQACPAGKFTSSTGQGVCLDCPAGSFNAIAGSPNCTLCPAGQVQIQSGRTFCTPCSEGEYMDTAGQVVCLECPAGSFSNTTGTIQCTDCAVGLFSSTGHSTSCSACPIGRFAATEGLSYCEDCPGGTASALTGVSACGACSAGSFQPLQGQTSCSSCLIGTATASTGQVVCSDCSVGTFSNSTGLTGCFNCPSGFYASSSRSTVCLPCEVGRFAGGSATASCDVCPVGRFANTTGQSACTLCEAGRFQATAGATTCTECPSGSANGVIGQVSCRMCDLGFFTASTGATTCASCDAGTYSVNAGPGQGPTSCTNCSAGSFTSSGGQSACAQCAVGYAAAAAGSSSCDSCSPGTFASASGMTSCQPCGVGRFASGSASITCSLCPAGSFTNATGAAVCTSCLAGQFQASQGMSLCSNCDVGRFSSASGQALCLPCDTGRFANTSGVTSCAFCSPGTFQSLSGRTSCDPCPVGSATAEIGQPVCVECDAGLFASSPGMATCSKCPAGSFSQKQLLSGFLRGATSCTSCPTGTYLNAEGQAVCLDCPVGTYSDALGLTTCKQCEPGAYQSAAGSLSCNPCEAGKYAESDGAITCSDCPAGTYSAVEGSSTCDSCDAGSYQSDTGQVACLPCAPGSFMANLRARICTPCSVGTFANVSGSQNCSLCAPGSHQTRTGQTECTPCAPGQFMANPGQELCEPCAQGHFTNQTGSISCTSCDPGTSQILPGSSACDPCNVGEFNSAFGQSRCSRCAPGTFSNVTGSQACIGCNPGSFQPQFGATECDPCDVGTYQPAGSQETCRFCPSGRFANITGQQDCINCALGYFQLAIGSSYCDACVAGSYSPASGQSRCSLCDPGRFSAQNASFSCSDCIPGSFQDEYGAQACKSCTQGTFQANPGQVSCRPCAEGTAINATNSTACVPCIPGYYQRRLGQRSCDACPVGEFNIAQGQSECFACGYGTFSNLTASTSCSACDVGKQQDSTGASTCLACLPGEYNDATGQRNCKSCGLGQYSTAYGATVCFQCSKGQFQSSSGQTACINCEAGRYTDVVGTDFCKPCKAGFYSSVSGAEDCDACSPGQFQNSQGSTECTSCPIGRYISSPGQAQCELCTVGTFGNTTGLRACYPCPAGTFQASEGQWRCRLCTPGTFSLGAKEICDACPDGTVTATNGTVECVACGANSKPNFFKTICDCNSKYYYPDQLEGNQQCKRCPEGADCIEAGTRFSTIGALPGYWRIGNESLTFYRCILRKHCTGGNTEAGSSKCSLHHTGPLCGVCEVGFYASAGGNCSPCPSNNSSSWMYFVVIGLVVVAAIWLQLYIIVKSGSDLLNNVVAEEDKQLQVEDDMAAAADTTTAKFKAGVPAELQAPELSQLSHEGSVNSASYSESEAGPDDREVSDGSASGSEHSGDADEHEDDGSHSEDGSGSEYSDAGSGGSEHASSRSVSAKSLQSSGVTGAVIQADGSRMMTDADTLSGAQPSSLPGALSLRKPIRRRGRRDSNVFYDDELFPENDNEVTIHGPPKPKPNFTYKLKIALGFAQIVTNLATGLEIQWPNTFQEFMLWLQVLNFDFILLQGSSSDCVSSFGYYRRYILVAMAPIIIFVLISVFYLLPRYFGIACFKRMSATARIRSQINFWKMFLYLLFLIYPAISSSVLRLYVCKQIGNTSYLLADLRVQCYTETWTRYSFGSMALVLLYPIGIPLFFFTLLYFNKDALRTDRIKAQIGFLYEGYRTDVWWFEIVDSFHKLFLTSVLAFFPSLVQLPIGMTAAVLYLIVLLRVNPYSRPSDDRLHMLAQCEIFLLLCAGNVFYYQPLDAFDHTSDLIFSVVLIMVAMSFFAGFLYSAVTVVWQMCSRWRHNRKTGHLRTTAAAQEEVKKGRLMQEKRRSIADASPRAPAPTTHASRHQSPPLTHSEHHPMAPTDASGSNASMQDNLSPVFLSPVVAINPHPAGLPTSTTLRMRGLPPLAPLGPLTMHSPFSNSPLQSPQLLVPYAALRSVPSTPQPNSPTT